MSFSDLLLLDCRTTVVERFVGYDRWTSGSLLLAKLSSFQWYTNGVLQDLWYPSGRIPSDIL